MSVPDSVPNCTIWTQSEGQNQWPLEMDNQQVEMMEWGGGVMCGRSMCGFKGMWLPEWRMEGENAFWKVD